VSDIAGHISKGVLHGSRGAVTGLYRPPLGRLGAGLDRAIMHRAALSTIQAFTRNLGTAITHPAPYPDPAHSLHAPEARTPPEPDSA
jgi:hypothetical protein